MMMFFLCFESRLFFLPDLAFIASKLEAMLKRASRGESPVDFLLPVVGGSLGWSWSCAQGRTIPCWPPPRCSAAVL